MFTTSAEHQEARLRLERAREFADHLPVAAFAALQVLLQRPAGDGGPRAPVPGVNTRWEEPGRPCVRELIPLARRSGRSVARHPAPGASTAATRPDTRSVMR